MPDGHCHRILVLRSVVGVDRKEEIREFLISRRAKISPEQAGIPSYGELRRVPGLRREEVAQLAGVSTDYYTRLERGSIRGVSDSVLEAVASALQLDEAERAHLMDLARTANTSSCRAPRRPMQQRVRPGVLRLLDGMTGVAAMVQNGRGDVLAANLLGRALYAEDSTQPCRWCSPATSPIATPDKQSGRRRIPRRRPRTKSF